MIKKLLEDKILIGYEPLKDEVDYCPASFGVGVGKHFVIPNKKSRDPFLLAMLFSERFNGEVVVLVPGQKFDASGTRHGRGGGWYDRFLSKIPVHWSRVGIAHVSKFYNSKLVRQTWDEPVDWVIVCDGSSWSLHETLARHF